MTETAGAGDILSSVGRRDDGSRKRRVVTETDSDLCDVATDNGSATEEHDD